MCDTVPAVTDSVKRRAYRSALRERRAAATRRTILLAAQRRFRDQGFASTSVADIASDAGVSIDTLYASVGRKPQLLLGVIDMTLGGGEPVDAEARAYVRAIHAATSAEDKIATYARAIGRLLPATAPLVESLEQAAATDPECARTWRHLEDRRASNMRRLAAELRSTGQLRGDMTDDEVADILWSSSSHRYYRLLRERGWSAERFAAHLEDLWNRVLIELQPAR